MIRLVSRQNRAQHPWTMDAMFRARAATFHHRLNWHVAVQDGREMDRFDGLDPLRLVSVTQAGVSQASIRLMPTTGPTLLSEVFAGSFSEPVDIRSATVWEATRFCLHHDASAGAQQAAAEILIGICEVGLAAGLTTIIGVYDPRLVRIYRRIGWSPELLAESNAFAPGPIYVGLWEVSESALATRRARAGLQASVLETEPATLGIRAA